MAFSYRDAEPNDLDRIVAIYNATIASRMVTADTEPVSVESRVAWFRGHDPHSHPLWVCEDNGSITAWLSFSSFYGRPAYRQTAEISVYVDEKFRRRGYGAFLLGCAVESAPALGIRVLLGFIFGHNLPSLSLFEKQGFVRWGLLPKVAVLDGVERDLAIVGRRA